MRFYHLILIPVLAVLAFVAHANEEPAEQAPSNMADLNVAQTLTSLKYAYEVNPSGNYKLVFKLDERKNSAGESRTQLVYIRSKVESYGAFNVREVWSPGYTSETDGFPALIANQLLEDSNKSKMGAWVKQGRTAVFMTRIPADATPEELSDAMQLVMARADMMEESLTGDDDAL